ncbi:MAG: 5-formyltetrahydrofolate cyclo-ligase [Rhodothermaceae bacterium]|nr:5-formyltetrahydrofolate cyclo-ligase [Rhodothermaceae bacterium]
MSVSNKNGYMSKEEIRKKAKTYRSGLDTGEVERISRLIALTVLQSELYRNAEHILSYVPIVENREIDTNRINHQILRDGKVLVLPRMAESSNHLELVKTSDLNMMYKNSLNILEPIGNQYINIRVINLILVPMLAGDCQLNRLGYGKGYYDRLLERFTGKSCGLLYDECLYERIPAESYDFPLDHIITEKRIIPETTGM